MSVVAPVVDIWDGENRRIYLKQGTEAFHWIEDIYKEYRYWRRTSENARNWIPLLRAAGNDSKGGGKYTPRFVTLLEGTRVIPYDENALIQVTGEAITDNADVDPDPFDTTTRTQAVKLYIEPPAAEIVTVMSGGALTSQEHAEVMKVSEVKNKTDQLTFTEPGKVDAKNPDVDESMLKLIELCELNGLDPTKPLLVSREGREAGQIRQKFIKVGDSYIVQRE